MSWQVCPLCAGSGKVMGYGGLIATMPERKNQEGITEEMSQECTHCGLLDSTCDVKGECCDRCTHEFKGPGTVKKQSMSHGDKKKAT